MPEGHNLDDFAREVLDHALEAYQLVTPEYRYAYVNSAAARQMRKPREGMLGRTMMEVHPGVENTSMFAVLRKSMTQRVVQHLETDLKFDDGSQARYDVRFQPVPTGLLILSVDITARSRAEQELARSRRVLSVISGANHALVGATDAVQFMQQVCNVAVEAGGYRLAWIGVKQDDAACSVRAVAVAGVDEGYTAALHVTWDESPRGQGPAGRSIRTGAAVTARFISTDPAFGPWRENAIARGYASALCLPYRIEGEVEGALCIYSGEPDAFDEHEKQLLGELALNLGHGVQALRTRAFSRGHAERLARLNERLERLARVVKALFGMRDVSSIVSLVRMAARDLSSAHGAVFVLREGDHCLYVGEEPAGTLSSALRIPMSQCVGGWVIQNRENAVIEDASADPRVPPDMHRPSYVRGLAMVPIRREDPLGAIGVYWHHGHRATDDDMRVLETLAHSTAIAMETVRVLDALSESDQRYRDLVEHIEDVVFSIDAEGRFQYLSPSIAKYGYELSDIIGQHYSRFVHRDDLPQLRVSMERTLAGQVEPIVFRALDRSGREHFVRTSSRVVMRGGRPVAMSGVMVDITELRRTEEQLQIAQRMEAVGQLAGGVAHDFNNLLSVILSYATFVGEAVRDNEQARSDVEEITKAGLRAAALTRQLLAFSRKQVLAPQVLELNRLAGELEKMLRRLIGEDVELVQRLAPDLGRVKADPGQIEQVIMNLVVNARDAMPRGGTLTIETSNVEIDQEAVAAHPTLRAGSFVALAVSDTGVGMDETTKQRLFEPFFTTKGVGKGTGLGLSTVYGIVAQSGGSIWFDSQLGVGTTFKVYLPRVADLASPTTRRPQTRASGGHETILLVEDDQAVRSIAERLLRGAGYRVLAAGSGSEALGACEATPGAIDLLLTDVVMPQMSGKQLADRLTEMRPGLRVLYMSGYTGNIIERHGLLDPGTMFIGKPFSADALSTKVRDVLDMPRAHAEAADPRLTAGEKGP